MKRVLKLTLFAVILIMTMMMSKTVLADERKDAKVDYEYNSDGTAKVTITFSESVEGFNTLIESGWQLSGNTATKTIDRVNKIIDYNEKNINEIIDNAADITTDVKSILDIVEKVTGFFKILRVFKK